MPVFNIVNQHEITSEGLETITQLHFGGNVLTNYDELLDPGSDFLQGLEALSLQTLRFPGGAVTEQYFDVSNPEATSTTYHGNIVDLIPMTEFFRIASHLETSVTIVIPTIHGFETSAAEAVLDGSFGSREVDQGYISEVAAFVVEAIRVAQATGVVLDAFEIGNEFWGSGEMSAIEYGRLASQISIAVETALLESGIIRELQPDILVQGISAAGLYSPTPISSSRINIYQLSDGSVWSSASSYNIGDIPIGFHELSIALDLGEFEIPNQGFINFQNRQITSELQSVDGAVDAIDGFVLHYYGDAGISDIDTMDQTLFGVFEVLAEIQSSRSQHLPDLVQYVTEWNMRAWLTHQQQGNGGLLHSSYLVEMFYEMVTNGVEAAHVWPIRNEGTQLSSLLDVDGDGLSLSGEALRMMSELLIGLTPSLDFEESHEDGSGHIDVHGFSSESRDVLFVSERGGINGIQSLNISQIVDGRDFFFTVEVLWTDGDLLNPRSEPISYFDGLSIDQQTSTIDLLLRPHSLASIEITYITEGSDLIYGRGGDDLILSRQGDDIVHGHDGDDSIRGGSGDDLIYGGAGRDDLFGNDGNDTLYGGEGGDEFLAGSGNDLVVIDEFDILMLGGDGFDVLSLADFSFGVHVWLGYNVIEMGSFETLGFDGFEGVVGTDYSDGITSFVDFAIIDGASGNDVIDIWSGDSVSVSGGAGDDWILVHYNNNGHFSGGDGSDRIQVLWGNATVDGGRGDDQIGIFREGVRSLVFEYGDGNDTVRGFNFDSDELILNGFDTEAVLLEAHELGTLVRFSASDSILFFDDFGISSHDFLF